MKITAAVVRERSGPFNLEGVDLSEPRAGEVLVRLAASGICQTDVHARDGYFPIPYPAVYGHEGAGVVERTGSGVETVKPGDHVVMVFPSCGMCVYCKNGKPAYCVAAARLKNHGTRADGSTPMTLAGAPVFSCFFQQSSFATFALATERNVVRVPEDLPLELAAAFPCGVNTGAGAVFNVLRPARSTPFAVFGTGSVGLAGLMAARIAGCEPIIAVDLHPNRIELAQSLGATNTIDPSRCDPVTEIRKMTGGHGVGASLEAAGSPDALRQAVDSLAPLGTCCLVGSSRTGTEVNVDMRTLQNGRTLRGCIQGDAVPDQFMPYLFQLYREGKLPVHRMVTFYDFADINRAVADSMAGKVIKPVLRMPD